MEQQKVIVKVYKGNQQEATEIFQSDAAQMATHNYFPTSQTYTPGSYGCGAFIGALLLCLLLIGFIVFIYMLIVKPAGVLSVTYEYREPKMMSQPEAIFEEKTCPMCAEQVKAEAKLCRYCGYQFHEASYER